MKEEKILTMHPQGKRGVNISRQKYNLLRESIITCLRNKELTFTEMLDQTEKRLKNFDGSVPWHLEAVKLDLEAREVIERVKLPGKTVYRLKGDSANL